LRKRNLITSSAPEGVSEKAGAGREAWYDDGEDGRGGVEAGPENAQGVVSGIDCAIVEGCFVVIGIPKAKTYDDLLMGRCVGMVCAEAQANNKFGGGGGAAMAERWTDEFSASTREWCDKVTNLGVDMLVRAGLLPEEEFGRASGIVAEELFVRLCLRDYPPSPVSLSKAPDAEPGAAADGGA